MSEPLTTEKVFKRAKPLAMTEAQRNVLRTLNSCILFPGYCELMLDAGLKSYKSVDWVLDALERRGYVRKDDGGDYEVTDSGRAALKA